jgi:predicted nucleic acid-binding protein
MGRSPTWLTDPDALLVADASTVININASGCGPMIVKALPNPVAIVNIIAEELEEGRHRLRQDADLLNDLKVARLVEIVELDDVGAIHFEQLVIGPAEMTLDDGEAATIAYAVGKNGIPLIDERKATRICARRFPELRIASTVDIFTHPELRAALGKDKLADAVFNALCHGRMRVFPHHVEWVVELIGRDRAGLCTSLPRSARITQQAVSKKSSAIKEIKERTE